jgi:hypothetical protein
MREGKIGIWIHEEDLFIEQSPLASLHPRTIIATRDSATWKRLRYPKIKTTWLETAIDDEAKRASNAFGIEVEVSGDSPITEALLGWAAEHQLQQIAAMRLEIGPLHDQLDYMQAALSNAGIELILFDRPEDLAIRPLATGGFFGFWEKMQNKVVSFSLPVFCQVC